jgi:chorismate mutase
MKETTKKLNIASLSQWFGKGSRPFIISGPCSAESREQVLATAEGLHQTGMVSAFRSGIWKPRTRPGAFEGHGAPALKWLTEVKQTYNMPVAVEVATPAHVEACLKEGIDILWVGARTSVNPFSVQELAEALRGVDIPVMIKNPLNPDLALWVGVIERFYNGGLTRIAAIHRGFNTFEKSRYRNEPLWEIPIKLKTIFPELPLLCDPSHIAGQREYLQEIIQRALLLDMDGFMIESHIDPSCALTDAAQQVTPHELKAMITGMEILAGGSDPCRELEVLRSKIDELDGLLVNLLAKRMDVVRDIATVKKECKITVLQLKRWNHIIESRTQDGIAKGLSREFLSHMLDLIHKESIEIQSRIIT